MLQTCNFDLEVWQQRAVKSWAAGDCVGPFRGTLEIFTGGGKTLIALSCAELAAKIDSGISPLISAGVMWLPSQPL
jgi:superfamily II DNA or RNA helicase